MGTSIKPTSFGVLPRWMVLAILGIIRCSEHVRIFVSFVSPSFTAFHSLFGFKQYTQSWSSQGMYDKPKQAFLHGPHSSCPNTPDTSSPFFSRYLWFYSACSQVMVIINRTKSSLGLSECIAWWPATFGSSYGFHLLHIGWGPLWAMMGAELSEAWESNFCSRAISSLVNTKRVGSDEPSQSIITVTITNHYQPSLWWYIYI